MIKSTPASPPAPAPAPADSDRIFSWILAGFALVCASVVVMVFVATRNLERAQFTSDSVNHTQALILDANELVAQLFAADTTMRAYLATGADRERSACHTALNECVDRLASMQALTRQDEAQFARTGKIGALLGQRVDLIHDVLGSDTAASRAEAARLIETASGRDSLRQIKEQTDELKLSALEELRHRDRENYRQAQTTRWTVWSGLLLDFLLLGGMAALLRNDLAARRARTMALQEDNFRLEEAVERRTRDLRAANERLQDDVIEQTWDRLALEHQLNYNQLIINSIREAVIVITKAQHISRVNPAVLHLTGRPQDDIINRPLHDIIRMPNDATGTGSNELLRRAMDDGQDLRYQSATLTNRLGHNYSVILNLFPLRDSGMVVGAVIIIDDPLLYQHHRQPTELT